MVFVAVFQMSTVQLRLARSSRWTVLSLMAFEDAVTSLSLGKGLEKAVADRGLLATVL